MDFLAVDFRKKRHYVYWSGDHIAYTGVPFMMRGTKILVVIMEKTGTLN